MLISMAAALRWKIGLTLSTLILALLTQLGVKPQISLTAIFAHMNALRFLGRLAGRLLELGTLFLAKAPVTFLNLLFTVTAASLRQDHHGA